MALSLEQSVWLLKFFDNLRSIHYYVVSSFNTIFLQKRDEEPWRFHEFVSHLSRFLYFNRQTTKTGFQDAGIDVLPRHLNPWKFHAPISSLVEGVSNKVRSMINSNMKY